MTVGLAYAPPPPPPRMGAGALLWREVPEKIRRKPVLVSVVKPKKVRKQVVVEEPEVIDLKPALLQRLYRDIEAMTEELKERIEQFRKERDEAAILLDKREAALLQRERELEKQLMELEQLKMELEPLIQLRDTTVQLLHYAKKAIVVLVFIGVVIFLGKKVSTLILRFLKKGV